ncbi:unnamed protein product [marine sediment metagenome]|uniref:Uncharacterized protein n=1 Tax=marine sediment metagenome TaxID=412755 RepID=X0VY64_9ZZZZ
MYTLVHINGHDTGAKIDLFHSLENAYRHIIDTYIRPKARFVNHMDEIYDDSTLTYTEKIKYALLASCNLRFVIEVNIEKGKIVSLLDDINQNPNKYFKDNTDSDHLHWDSIVDIDSDTPDLIHVTDLSDDRYKFPEWIIKKVDFRD